MKTNQKRFKTLPALIFVLCALLLFASCSQNENVKTGESAAKENRSEEETVSVTTPDYKSIEGIYICKLAMSETMSVELYLKIDKDGAFVFGRDAACESTEKGAGKIVKTEDGKDVFMYTALNGETVPEGEKAAEYRLDNGDVVFVSPMWFGSTEPKLTAPDGNITYPRFVRFDPEAVRDDSSAETSETSETSAPDPQPPVSEAPASEAPVSEPPVSEPPVSEPPVSEPPVSEPPVSEAPVSEPPISEPPAPVFSEGTYTGSLSKYVDAMSSNVKYDVTVTFGGGRYDYSVQVTLSGGMDYSAVENYTGSYTLNGDSLSMSGKMTGCTVRGSSLELTGYLSSFASSPETVTVTK